MNIKNIGKTTSKCISCGERKYNAPMYEWTSLVTDELLGIVCKKCAVREMFGSNFRRSKKYQKWIKENK